MQNIPFNPNPFAAAEATERKLMSSAKRQVNWRSRWLDGISFDPETQQLLPNECSTPWSPWRRDLLIFNSWLLYHLPSTEHSST
ncbi:hypothetical protein CDAR_533661 [Caerostris darwini]|uniref:Uncharacterized protein n=1 Tax=Caerostris darwini TaxID=1538125 RepID=A0AAV4S5E2_9ARAC|nr:hypothetical protein CDAR_533661 [Caerostris darwini]